MRYLLVSDIHSNWEALQAVLEDAAGHYDAIVSCGDLVGYGPDPNRIVEWSRRNLQIVLRGNHDRACCGMEDLEWFNPVAQAATRWTIGELAAENVNWLKNLPQGPLQVGSFTMAHGSPLDEDEYVATMADAANVFPYLETELTFFGHTHLQGGFFWLEGRQRALARTPSEETSSRAVLERDGAYLINPGSVGQPRDGDPRAAYALFDTEVRHVELCRVGYDVEAVSRKIERSGLPSVLGFRLTVGR